MGAVVSEAGVIGRGKAGLPLTGVLWKRGRRRENLPGPELSLSSGGAGAFLGEGLEELTRRPDLRGLTPNLSSILLEVTWDMREPWCVLQTYLGVGSLG